MIGWKPVERHVSDGVDLTEAKQRLEAQGFTTHVDNPQHAVLRRDGARLSLTGEDLPLEVAVAEAERGLYLQLRYDTFVLFDTGDLEQVADETASILSS